MENKVNISGEQQQRGEEIVRRLRVAYPDAKCSLNYRTPLELLVATMLSAQCTDERVNAVTATLFEKYRDAADFAAAHPEELEQDVKQTGFYRNKAKHIREASQQLLDRFNGEVPRSIEELTSLPGVARKTANVVRGNAYGLVDGVVVDTHVTRLSQRLGLTTSDDPVKIEQDLMCVLPRQDWLDASHLLIYHGRAICQARRPQCEECPLAELCPTGQQRLTGATAIAEQPRRVATARRKSAAPPEA